MKAKIMKGVRFVGYGMKEGLSAIQMGAIILAALVAADFFIFTPNVKWLSVPEDRVGSQTVRDMYGTRPVPPVVDQTLVKLDALSFPRPQAPIPSGPLPSEQSVRAGVSIADPFPLADLCSKSARSRDMIEDLFRGACVPATKIDVPFFDRALVSFNVQSQAPLDSSALREAASFFAEALFVRVTLTISNTGRSTATNVTVIPVDGYHAVAKPPTTVAIGKSVAAIYETDPGAALKSTKGAVISNPSWEVRADPTGPVDPWLIKVGFIGLAIWCGLIAVFRFVAGPSGTSGA